MVNNDPTPAPTGTEADDDIVIDEDAVPLGPVSSPGAEGAAGTSGTPKPGLSADAGDEELILDDEVPLGGVDTAEELPQTGEASPLPYYLGGAGLAGLGLLLSRTGRTDRGRRR
ncbi:LPXTG cell wall anchor domain-containing protein [Paenibacillus tengchongensis]|uniref:LPXTG cell wall anchor domain-containing protein n=1 Tax=Paenibacillus tengchongensis TaxID=2608684 RepID=UPI001FEAD98C|nr:LPXTG cell wall anchor domain-containing protein [Paenibacillus tengchongensis]